MAHQSDTEKEPTFRQKIVPWLVASIVLFIVFLIKGIIDARLGIRFGGGAIIQSIFTVTCIGLWCIIFYCPLFKINKIEKRQKKFETSAKWTSLPLVIFFLVFLAQVTDERRNTVEDTPITFHNSDESYTGYEQQTTTYVINKPSVYATQLILRENTTKEIQKYWVSALESEAFLTFTGAFSSDEYYSAVFVTISDKPCLVLNIDRRIENGQYHGEIIIDGNVYHVSLTKNIDNKNNFVIHPDGFSSRRQLYRLMARGNTMQVNLLAGNTAILATFSLHGFTAATKRAARLKKR